MADKFGDNMEALFKGMEHFITTKTVVGEPIHVDDTIILPLIEVSFGAAAGASNSSKKDSNQGGMGGKITPSSVLVIKNGITKVINVKKQDVGSKIMDMVPDIINKFTDSRNEKAVNMPQNEDDVNDILDKME